MTWMYFVFMYIIPFSLLAVFNFLIYRKIKRSSQIRTSVTRWVWDRAANECSRRLCEVL